MPPRISIFTLGSRGDTQPFCVLGRALQQAGYDVALCAPEPYRPFVESFGLKLRPIGSALAGLKDSESMNALVRGGIKRLVGLPAFYREARGGLVDFLTECWQATEHSDLVVFIPTTFFVADFARMRGIPSVRVALQPMLPTSDMRRHFSAAKTAARFSTDYPTKFRASLRRFCGAPRPVSKQRRDKNFVSVFCQIR